MEVEQLQIRDQLSRFEPFDRLPDEWIDLLASRIEIGYFKAGSQIMVEGDQVTQLHIIRSGAVELYRRNGDLYNRLAEGGIFGHWGLLMNRPVRFPATAIEDTLIYFIDKELFDRLWEDSEVFAQYVEVEDHSRLRSAVSQQQNTDLMTSRVHKLLSRTAVVLPQTATLHEAALAMTSEGVSSLVITDPDNEQQPGVMVGIITDRDLRTRAMAERLSYETPVSQIMSTQLITIDARAFVFDAMLNMLRYNIHHLPVMRLRKPLGVLALSDIIRYESQSSLYLVSQIHRQNTVADLKSLTPDVRATFIRMVNEGATSHMIGSAIAGIGRSFTQRLLELGEEALGPPPVPYCFLALGSMARDEQYMMTDQDNALVLSDDFIAAEHDDYFLKLAAFVSDGLAECGYEYCKGDIMATNKQWRQPLTVWREYFKKWINEPDPQSLLHSSIFFDLDGIYGDTAMAETLKLDVAERAKRSPRFLACLARNALNRTPPLGFFRTFVMESDGKHNKTINLKRRGTAPLSDVIRVHALAAGSTAQNSFNRLDVIAESRILGHSNGDDLRDAMEYIAIVRARHQSLALESEREPDNSVEPENMTEFERRNLKDAFQVLSNAQKYLRMRYQVNRV
jgi:CBS domain-containing protein